MNRHHKTLYLLAGILGLGLIAGSCNKPDPLVSKSEGTIYMPQAYSTLGSLKLYLLDSPQTVIFGAAYGGLTCFRFLRNDKVDAWPLAVDTETLYNLEDNLLLFFTGYSRSASTILKEQDQKSQEHDRRMEENLHFVKDLGLQSKEALEAGNLHRFAELMNVHWEYKKQRSGAMSNDQIDAWYRLALANGALGGKLIGAGGGGFLMFYAEDKPRLRHAMAQTRLREVRFRFDFEGTKVLNQ